MKSGSTVMTSNYVAVITLKTAFLAATDCQSDVGCCIRLWGFYA